MQACKEETDDHQGPGHGLRRRCEGGNAGGSVHLNMFSSAKTLAINGLSASTPSGWCANCCWRRTGSIHGEAGHGRRQDEAIGAANDNRAGMPFALAPHSAGVIHSPGCMARRWTEADETAVRLAAALGWDDGGERLGRRLRPSAPDRVCGPGGLARSGSMTIHRGRRSGCSSPPASEDVHAPTTAQLSRRSHSTDRRHITAVAIAAGPTAAACGKTIDLGAAGSTARPRVLQAGTEASTRTAGRTATSGTTPNGRRTI